MTANTPCFAASRGLAAAYPRPRDPPSAATALRCSWAQESEAQANSQMWPELLEKETRSAKRSTRVQAAQGGPAAATLTVRQVMEDNRAVLRLLQADPGTPLHDHYQARRSSSAGAAGNGTPGLRPPGADQETFGAGTSPGPGGMAAAARTTLNAHYTDPRLVRALWSSVDDLDLDGGVVLERGRGAGVILAAAGPAREAGQ